MKTIIKIDSYDPKTRIKIPVKTIFQGVSGQDFMEIQVGDVKVCVSFYEAEKALRKLATT